MPAGTTAGAGRRRAASSSAPATQAMGGCGGAAADGAALGAELVANDQVRVRDLPPALQQMLLNLSVGQATPAFGSPERISVLVLCGRDDPPAASAPNPDADRAARWRRSGSTAARSVICATCGATRWSTIAEPADNPARRRAGRSGGDRA